MKQLRWIVILGITAVLLTVVFIFVDRAAKNREERAAVGAAKSLFAFDPEGITRITIDNEDGHFAFDWNDEAKTWLLVSGEQFNINPYAVAAIGNYFSKLNSLKTVAFDCQDTSVYGFDSPVTLKVYTDSTGEEHPYVLYVGDCTPTYDAYYAMTDASNDVYTIDYTSGSIFCVAKNTLKNMYLYDTTSTSVYYYRTEIGGKTAIELQRNDDWIWELLQPVQRPVFRADVDSLMEIIVRAQLERYIEENPENLAQYGLDQPAVKIWIRSRDSAGEMSKEIWFSSTNAGDDTHVYGYFADSKEVFSITKGEASFATSSIMNYLDPYCADVTIEELKSIEIDMGEVYDLHETLYVDYENEQYAFGDTDITALDNEEILSKFTDLYRAVTLLQFSDVEPDAEPEGEAAISVTYTYKNGKVMKLEFIPKAENDYYLMKDGVYDDVTVRLNRFTEATCIIPAYEALANALKSAH